MYSVQTYTNSSALSNKKSVNITDKYYLLASYMLVFAEIILFFLFSISGSHGAYEILECPLIYSVRNF